jgi:hypothetical protein
MLQFRLNAGSIGKGDTMTWKDKLELGLKNDAPFRKDNLPEQEVKGPEVPAGPGRSPIVVDAVVKHDDKKQDEIAAAEDEIPAEQLPKE